MRYQYVSNFKDNIFNVNLEDTTKIGILFSFDIHINSIYILKN